MNEKGNRRRFGLAQALLVIAVSVPWLIQATRRSIDSMFNAPPLWCRNRWNIAAETTSWFRRLVFQAHDTVELRRMHHRQPRLEDFSNALLSSDDPAEDRRRQRYFQRPFMDATCLSNCGTLTLPQVRLPLG